MPAWLEWIKSMEYSKPVALLIFFIAFIAIVAYVYTGKKRKDRLESYKYIPLDDEIDDTEDEQGKSS